MASTALETTAGSGGTFAYAKTGTTTLAIIAGAGGSSVAALPTGTNARRPAMDWLPRADEVCIDPKTGRMTRRFYQFLREVAEVRLGGVQGTSVTEVASSVTATQTSINTVVAFAQEVGQYAQGVAATAAATREVAQDSGLSGSGSIPPSPTSPPTYEP